MRKKVFSTRSIVVNRNFSIFQIKLLFNYIKQICFRMIHIRNTRDRSCQLTTFGLTHHMRK